MASLQTHGEIYIGDEKVLNIYLGNTCVYQKSIYPDDWVDDGKLWGYTTIETDGTYRVTDDQRAYWDQIEIDGEVVTNNRDQYLSAGNHIVKITLKNTTTLQGIFRGRDIYNTIVVPSTITTLGDYCFYGTTNAKIIMDKSKITSIGTSILFHSTCTIGDINFPNLISLTGNSNFNNYYAANTQRIKSLGSITTIPLQSFRECLTKDNIYIIPATVTSIGQLAFYNRGDFTYYCYPVTPPTLGSQPFYSTPVIIYVPAGSVSAYKTATGWSQYANQIQALPE